MVVLRSILAFPMYGSAAWLAWVFALQAGVNAEALLLAAAVAAGFAAWAWGLSQQSARPLTPRLWALMGVVALIGLAAMGASNAQPIGTTPSATTALPTQPWSQARVDELRAQGKPVFVDFTAAWCITCQVNERTALAGKDVADAFAKTGAVYLKADWTNPNPDIAKALADHGRSGVPLYLVYGPSGDPQVLPQILTQGVVVEALNKAKGAS
jgi:thiol:disulfide interchange protein DsbD